MFLARMKLKFTTQKHPLTQVMLIADPSGAICQGCPKARSTVASPSHFEGKTLFCMGSYSYSYSSVTLLVAWSEIESSFITKLKLWHLHVMPFQASHDNEQASKESHIFNLLAPIVSDLPPHRTKRPRVKPLRFDLLGAPLPRKLCFALRVRFLGPSLSCIDSI